MMGTEAFRSVFGAVPAGDEESTVRIVLGAVRAGFAVVLVKPGLKAPMCTLSAQQAKAADVAAQELARTQGHPRPGKAKHACGISHALHLTGDLETKTKEEGAITRVVRRVLKQTGGRVNLGVELGRSRMVVVDVDTAAENAAFLADWIAAEGPDAGRMTYTVQSPGAQKADGSWTHSDGGHYWFTLPEGVTLPDGADGALKSATGWTVMWNNRQVLVPPSSRPEGHYRMVGAASPAPGWLTDMIRAGAKAKLDRKVSQTNVLFDADDPIDRWSAETPWAELLADPDHDEWTDTGLVDNCSCPIWTAPGDHASPKSATAHEIGCDRWDSSTGWAPLRVWTDSPPDFLADAGRNLTKLHYVALRDYGGNDRDAMTALGLRSENALEGEYPGFTDSAYDFTDSPLHQVPRAFVPPVLDRSDIESDTSDVGSDIESDTVTDPFTCADDTSDTSDIDIDPKDGVTRTVPVPLQPVDDSPAAMLRRHMLSSAELDDIADPVSLVAGVFDTDTLARVTGKSGHGKTFFMIDVACCVATDQPWQGHPTSGGLVIYMVAEGLRGFKRRIRAWEARYNGGKHVPADRLQVIPFPIQVTDPKGWAALRGVLTEDRPAMLILDTQARVTVGVNENDATEMGRFIDKVEAARRDAGTCVVLVHHLGHSGDQGRGSSAVLGAINTEIRVSKAGGVVSVINEKQKDEEGFEAIELTLDREGESAVLVGPPPTDPFDDGSVTAESRATLRMLKAIWETAPEVGLTKGEAKGMVLKADRDRNGHSMSSRTFLRSWDEVSASGDLIRVEGTQRWKVSRDAQEKYGLES